MAARPHPVLEAVDTVAKLFNEYSNTFTQIAADIKTALLSTDAKVDFEKGQEMLEKKKKEEEDFTSRTTNHPQALCCTGLILLLLLHHCTCMFPWDFN